MATSIIPVIKLECPKSAHAAYDIFGLKPGASRDSVEDAYKRKKGEYKRKLQREHPDRHDGRNTPQLLEVMAATQAIEAAYKLILEYLPLPAKPGRPTKLVKPKKVLAEKLDGTKVISGGFAIVDTVCPRKTSRGKTVLVHKVVKGHESYDTREQAEEALRRFQQQVKDARARKFTGKEIPSDKTDLVLVRELKKRHRPRYRVVGSPGAERVKKHRAKKKLIADFKASMPPELYRRLMLAKLSRYWNKKLCELGFGVSRGLYLPQADSGKGLLITGGWNWKQIENVTAARDAAAGGPDSNTRNVRAPGNGPDVFERTDVTADYADIYFDARMSDRDFDDGTGTPSVLRSYDQLLCPSVEDRTLPPVLGWDQPVQRAYRRIADDDDDGTGDIYPEQISLRDEASEKFSEFPEMGEDDFGDLLEQYEEPEEEPESEPIMLEPSSAIVTPEPAPELTIIDFCWTMKYQLSY